MKLYIQLSRRLYLTVPNATVYEDRKADRVITGRVEEAEPKRLQRGVSVQRPLVLQNSAKA